VIEAIRPEAVALVWSDAEPFLHDACEHSGERTTHDVLIQLVTGNAQLWRIHDKAWAVSEVINYPRKKVASITLAGGRDARSWAREFQEVVIKWAKHYQADEIRCIGRRGWLRWRPEQSHETTVIHLCLRPSCPQ
jgi:hypothetical protein